MLELLLMYHEDSGWCASMDGPGGSGGHRIPIIDFVERWHAFFKLPGPPFGPYVKPSATPLPQPKKAKRKKARRKA